MLRLALRWAGQPDETRQTSCTDAVQLCVTGSASGYRQHDIEADTHYGFCLNYDGSRGPQCTYVAALIASESPSKTDAVGIGFKVVTAAVKDVANPKINAGASQPAANAYKTVGYCTMEDLPGFRLDPPRGKTSRSALCLISKSDNESFHIHKLEYIEPDQLEGAISRVRKPRMLCKQIRPTSKDKRSYAAPLSKDCATPPSTKKARSLHAVPTDASWDNDGLV